VILLWKCQNYKNIKKKTPSRGFLKKKEVFWNSIFKHWTHARCIPVWECNLPFWEYERCYFLKYFSLENLLKKYFFIFKNLFLILVYQNNPETQKKN
jgi:hypothetical protein